MSHATVTFSPGRAPVRVALQVLSRHEEAEATAILLPEIGAERFEAMKGSLFQTVLCEQALQGLNEISLGLSTELPPVYMG